MSKYTVQQHAVQTLLTWVTSKQIAIPEMQRPFVWNTTKVRDLLDSLYQGFPIGYLITWQSLDVGLKDGTTSNFKQILIDGQQRITAMTAALVGEEVVDQSYKKKRIRIAFNPETEEFATWTPVIGKNVGWIDDVAGYINASSPLGVVTGYLKLNPEADPGTIEKSFEKLGAIKNAQVGIITLDDDLDINTVTEIFIRINSKGVVLGSADFAMSKIASHGEFGSNLRKLIDYFCHLSVAPHVYADIEANDQSFKESGYLAKIAWLRQDSSDLYDPRYTDIIRVAGLKEFKRGKVSAVVSYLAGRDFETKTFDPAIATSSFERLEKVLLQIVNKYKYQQFIMTIKSAGFITANMITAKNALNFAYALHLMLCEDPGLSDGDVKALVRRWFVMSLLTNRHSGSFESAFEQDIRRIDDLGAATYLKQIEDSSLSKNFWDVALPMQMNSTSTRSPYFQTYLAAQVHRQARGFLSKNITVANMLDDAGDVHHLVPKNYLQKNGVADRKDYNQIANFALTETPINIGIRDQAPNDYMRRVKDQIASSKLDLGEITDDASLAENLLDNAIPPSIVETTVEGYEQFLHDRRKLMAAYIRDYYFSL